MKIKNLLTENLPQDKDELLQYRKKVAKAYKKAMQKVEREKRHQEVNFDSDYWISDVVGFALDTFFFGGAEQDCLKDDYEKDKKKAKAFKKELKLIDAKLEEMGVQVEEEELEEEQVQDDEESEELQAELEQEKSKLDDMNAASKLGVSMEKYIKSDPGFHGQLDKMVRQGTEERIAELEKEIEQQDNLR